MTCPYSPILEFTERALPVSKCASAIGLMAKRRIVNLWLGYE
jgi:hypothetical protein